MTVVRRSIANSAVWLTKKVNDMAVALGRRGGRGLQDRKIVDGYLLVAKKTQGLPDKPGIASSMQSIEVRNSIHLSGLILDFPAFLCLPGRYYVDGVFEPDKAYIQTLDLGRDTYLPTTVSAVLDPRTSPLVRAQTWTVTDVGSPPSGNKLATRFWGSAQPFVGVGCMYGYGAVFLSSGATRLALGEALENDTFVYRLDVFTPTFVRLERTEGGEVNVPEEPTALPTTWTLQVPESSISNATAFVRLVIDRAAITPETESIISFWEAVQYPWLSFSPPTQYVDEDGNVGYTVHICAQVVFDQAGPYPIDLEAAFYPWAEEGLTPPAGARGLWVAKLQMINGQASILNQAAFNSLEDSDDRRVPWSSTFVDPSPGYVYQGNVIYKASPVTLNDGTMIVVASSFVTRQQVAEQPAPSSEGFWIFCDVFWLNEGVPRRQNLSVTQVTRELIRDEITYLGGVSMFDAGSDENRCVVGTATDGVIAVSVVFSAFRPGATPRLNVVVSTAESATIGYSGNPPFSMMMGSGGDESVGVGYIDGPVRPAEQQFWYWMTSDNQAGYMGNNKFCFYCSTQWTTPPSDAGNFIVSANLALAVYDNASGAVQAAGVIDPELTSSGTTSGEALTQIYSGRRVGNIEVLRKESDGYVKGEDGGNPATLVVTRGKGAPAVSVDTDEGQDITNGQTWISYDSGETWQLMLNYGSPVGAFHCGNIAQARTEPVVRV